jgi:prevent-host-death family protein
MPTITERELRNNFAQLLGQVESGEEFTVTVAGRPVARIGPASRQQWVHGPALQRIWQTQPPETLEDDLASLPGEIT